MTSRSLRAVVTIAALAIILLARYLTQPSGRGGAPPDANPPSRTAPRPDPASASSAADAFAAHADHVELETGGRVTRVLPTDNAGARHEKFLVRAGGVTILVVHNIDIAPAVPVHTGDSVVMRGEYVWNSQGGLLHWTHRDPDGRHQAGWIRLGQRLYQ